MPHDFFHLRVSGQALPRWVPARGNDRWPSRSRMAVAAGRGRRARAGSRLLRVAGVGRGPRRRRRHRRAARRPRLLRATAADVRPADGYAIRMEALGAVLAAAAAAWRSASRPSSESLEDLLEMGLTAGRRAADRGGRHPFTPWGSPVEVRLGGEPGAALRAARAGSTRRSGSCWTPVSGSSSAVGDSKSGKSRSMAEMLHRLRPGAAHRACGRRSGRAVQAGPAAAAARRPRAACCGWTKSTATSCPAASTTRSCSPSWSGRPGHGGRDHHLAPLPRPHGRRPGGAQRRCHEPRATPPPSSGRCCPGPSWCASRAGPVPEDLAAAQELYPDEDFEARGIGEQMVAPR